MTDHEFIGYHWNLVRGNICEEIATESLKHLGKPIQVGLLVKEKKEGAEGVAPDLLIRMDDGTIMPVEIKTTCTTERVEQIGARELSQESRDVRRELLLARRQLVRPKEILGSLCKKSCIVIVHFDDVSCMIVGIRATFIEYTIQE